MRAKAALLLLGSTFFACVTPSGAARSDIGSSLIGFDIQGSMIFLAEDRSIRAFTLPHGPERALFPGGTSAHIRALAREHGWKEPELWSVAEIRLAFEKDAALGDRRQLHVFLEDDEVRVPVASLPIAGEHVTTRALRSPRDDLVILSYWTHGRERLEVIDLAKAKSALLEKRAFARLETGDRLGATALFEAAVQTDPRSGNAIYNLACMHAVLGDLERAADELEIALALDPTRYRLLAKRDPDLAAVRKLPRFIGILGYSDE